MAVEIVLERLTVTMRRGTAAAVPVLDGLDLCVPASSICSIVGKSGCGKTTLLSAIAGVLDPSEASVEGGRRPASKDRIAVGMIFQRSFLLPWCTALENVALQDRVRGRRSSAEQHARARKLLARVGLEDHADKYPHELSGGMQQRVALAREFARPLDILLMDEPFASLDRVTRDELNECLLMFWAELKPTVVLVTHDPEEAVRIGDRVAVLGRNRVVGDVDVSSQLTRPRTRDVRMSATYGSLVECVLDMLHGT